MIMLEIIFSMDGVLTRIIMAVRILIVVVETVVVVILLVCNVKFAISLDMELGIVIIDWRKIAFLTFHHQPILLLLLCNLPLASSICLAYAICIYAQPAYSQAIV
ncbi:hypothetical protein AAZX31_10G105000 [Glycine max]